MPLYDGVNGVARKVVKFYDVVSRVSRTVTKAYSGVNGVARQYYSGNTVNIKITRILSDAIAGEERELEDSAFMVVDGGAASYTLNDLPYPDYELVVAVPKGTTVQFLAIYADFYGRDCEDYADRYLTVYTEDEYGYDYVQGHEAHTTGMTMTVDQDINVNLHIYCDSEDSTIVFGNVDIYPAGYSS